MLGKVLRVFSAMALAAGLVPAASVGAFATTQSGTEEVSTPAAGSAEATSAVGSAESIFDETEGWTYTTSSLGSDYAVLTGYTINAPDKDLVVPSEIDGKLVVGLSFTSEPNVASITFPDSDLFGDGSLYFSLGAGSFYEGKVTKFYFLGDIPFWSDDDESNSYDVFNANNGTRYTFWHIDGLYYSAAWENVISNFNEVAEETDNASEIVERVMASPSMLSLSYDYYHLNPGQTMTLEATQRPDADNFPDHLRSYFTTVTWVSDKPNDVASVAVSTQDSMSATITALGSGTATIMVYDTMGNTDTCRIVVDNEENFTPDFKGSGTQADPYQISSAQDLTNLSTYMLNDNYFLGRRASYVLTADIDLSQQEGFVPIGSASYPFRGHFDGAGHTVTINIQNLNSTAIGTKAVYDQALFGYVMGTSSQRATIHDLTVAGTVNTTNCLYVAGLVARCDYLDMYRCSNTANVTGSYYTGGLVGYASSVPDIVSGDLSLIGATTVAECSNSGTVTGLPRTEGNPYAHYVGGLVGYLRGASESDGSAGASSLSGCINTGKVVAQSNSDYVGGLVGKIDIAGKNWTLDEEDDVSTCAVSTEETLGVSLAGCFNYGAVTGPDTASRENIGAVVGGYTGDLNANDASAFIMSGCYYLEGSGNKLISGSDTNSSATITSCGATTAAQTFSSSLVEQLNAYAGENVFSKGTLYPVLTWMASAHAPSVVVNQAAVTVDVGQSVTISVEAHSAAGSASDAGLLYQWYECEEASGAGGAVIEGATGSSFTCSSDVRTVRYFYCEVSDPAYSDDADGTPLTRSDIIAVTFISSIEVLPPVITTQPAGPQEAVLQMTAVDLCVEAQLAASNEEYGLLSYQWYCSQDATGQGTVIEGATSPTYTVPNTQLGTFYYYCVVTNTYEQTKTASVQSERASITVEPLVVDTAKRLLEIANNVNEQGITYEGVSIVLGADIDLNDLATDGAAFSWTPIGSKQNRFMGSFDGQGHTISNLYVNAASGEDYGLFGFAENAVIQNLVLKDAVVTAPEGVAAVVGHVYGSAQLKNLGVESGYISSSGNADYPELGGAGGIVGRVGNASYDNTIVIDSCYNKALITCSGNSAGGIVGTAGSNTFIRSCYNWGTVSARNKAGGIVGTTGYQLENYIADCYNTGAVSISDEVSDTMAQVGAITGGNAVYGWSSDNSENALSYYLEGTAASSEGLAAPYEMDNMPVALGMDMFVSESMIGLLNTAGENYAANVAGRSPRLAWEALDETSYKMLDANGVTIEYTTTTYDGSSKEPAATVRYEDTLLAENVDYRISYSANVDAGTAKATVVGIGDYAGAVVKTFTIAPADIASATVADIPAQTFCARDLTPALQVTLSNADSGAAITLQEDTDYKATYTNNYHVGDASIAIEGTANFTGNLNTGFAIEACDIASSDIEVGFIPNQAYTGSPVMPLPSLTLLGTELQAGVDYYAQDADYENNIDIGTAAVTLHGMGDLTGTRRVEFRIVEAGEAGVGLKSAQVEDLMLNMGIEQPVVKVVNTLDEELELGTDYTVAYLDAGLNAVESFGQPGKYSAVIDGIGAYAGVFSSITCTFTVSPKPLTHESVQVQMGDYDGVSAPTIRAYDSLTGRTLYEGTHFVVTYEEKVTGGFEAVVSGIGTYTGELTFEYGAQTANNMIVYAGETRYETAAAIAADIAKNGPYDGVIIASAEENRFADALTGLGLSGVLDYPVVLVEGSASSLEGASRASVEAIAAGDKIDVIVLGGEAAVSSGVASALRSFDNDGVVTRIAGEDRYETAAAIYTYGAAHGGFNTDVAFIASGANFPDALSIGSFCSANAVALLIVPDDGTVPQYAREALVRSGSAVVVGGTAAVSPSVFEAAFNLTGGNATRVAGEDRYETGVAVVQWQLERGMTLDGAGVATGTAFPDALGCASLLSATNSVLLLASPDPADNAVLLELLDKKDASIDTLRVFGGDAAVSSAVRDALRTAIGGEWQREDDRR